MDYLTGNSLMNSNQILHTYQYLAAIGAGLLFVIEGTLLGIMVFSKKRSAQEIGARLTTTHLRDARLRDGRSIDE